MQKASSIRPSSATDYLNAVEGDRENEGGKTPEILRRFARTRGERIRRLRRNDGLCSAPSPFLIYSERGYIVKDKHINNLTGFDVYCHRPEQSGLSFRY